jgi:hemolysin activation/secretion protein
VLDLLFSSRKFLVSVSLLFVFLSSSVLAQVVPPSGGAGQQERSLRQSRPTEKPVEEKIPEIQLPKDRVKPGQKVPPTMLRGPSIFVKRIEIDGNTIFDNSALAPLVEIEQGRDMSVGELNRLANKVTSFYAERGYILTEAYVPQQKIQDGVVKIVVAEGRIGQVQVQGNKKIKSEDVLRRLKKLNSGKALKEQSLEGVLLQLNDQIGVSVRSTLRPGDLPGTSDLVLDISEGENYFFGIDGDNFGSRFTGENRFGATASVGNILSLGDQFYLRGIKSGEDLNYINASYLYFFNEWGFSSKFSYTHTNFGLGQSLSALKAGGDGNLFIGELGLPVYRSRSLQLGLIGGFEYRIYENFQLNTTVTSDNEIGDVYLGVGGNYRDQFLGWTFFDGRIQQTLFDDSQIKSLDRIGANDDATIATLNVTRFQNTNVLNSYFILKAIGQVATDRVLSPDQFSLGGVGTVRGYPLAEFSGDDGFVLSAEYVLPFPMRVPVGSTGLHLDEILSMVGFLDWGGVFVQDRVVGESRHNYLSGYGFGLQVNIPKLDPSRKWSPAISFALQYAKPLEGPTPTDGDTDVFYLNGAMNF